MKNKVKQIINEEFDSRMGLAVIQYLCEQVGMDNAAKITDEEIAAIEGNAIMTQEFCQAIVRCARRIATECSFVGDIVPYLINEYPHLSGRITQERTEDILCRYIDNDLCDADTGYVRDVLRDVCDVTHEEAEDLGIASLFEDEEEE